MSNDPHITAIGQSEPRCPYCGQDVKKVRGYRDCPHCGKYIHAKRRPLDEAYVMLTDDEALACEEQWAIVKGHHDQWLAERLRYEATAARIAERLGRPPMDREIKASIIADEKQEHARAGNWGLYRNSIYQIAELAWHARDYTAAIDLQSSVCMIDVAGPINTSGRAGPRFDGGLGFIAPGATCRLAEAAMNLGWTLGDLKHRFLTVAEQVRSELRIGVAAATAWKKVNSQIRKDYRQWAAGRTPNTG